MRISQRYLRPFSRRQTIGVIASTTVAIPIAGFVVREFVCAVSHQSFGMVQMIQWWQELGPTLAFIGFVSTSLTMGLFAILRRVQQRRG